MITAGARGWNGGLAGSLDAGDVAAARRVLRALIDAAG